MHALLRALGADPSDAAVAELFAAGHSFPLIDRRGATFVFRGDADAVNLRHWVYGLPAEQPFSRLGATSLWCLFLELPAESRIEYKIEVIRDGHGEWIVDPLNPLLAHDPFGANSVCHSDGYRRPDWTLPDPETASGRFDELRFHSAAFGAERGARLYLPARFNSRRRYPLLVVHDGDDYLRYAQLQAVLDNLTERRESAALVVALIDSGDRLGEYVGDPRHAAFVNDELLPRLYRELPLLDEPRGRCLMGASLGAVASLHAAWQRPGYYGKLLLQSGSFAFTDIGPQRRGPAFEPVVRFVNAFRDAPGTVARRAFVSCGVYESLIYENRSMVPLLQQHGVEVRYAEAYDGHNWENWRDRLREALCWLYPGPLWLFYP